MSFAQDGLTLIQNNNSDFSDISEVTSQAYTEDVDDTWMAKMYDSPLYKKTAEKSSYEEFTSDILRLRLNELDNQTPFNVEYNATVERFIRLYLNTRKNEISNLMDEAKYYFPIFEEYLDKYNLPL